MPIVTKKAPLAQTCHIPCPRCGQGSILWVPAPDQRVNENTTGPWTGPLPDYLDKDTRLSPPDAQGNRWRLSRIKRGKLPTFWPAELNCPRCVAEDRHASNLWSGFMGRPQRAR